MSIIPKNKPRKAVKLAVVLIVSSALLMACGLIDENSSNLNTTREQTTTGSEANAAIDQVYAKALFPFFEEQSGQRLWGLRNQRDVVVAPAYSYIRISEVPGFYEAAADETIFLLDAAGQVQLKAKSSEFYDALQSFNRTLDQPVPFYDAEAKQTGYTQADAVLIPPTFLNGQQFVDGFALVQRPGDETFSAVISTKGEVVLSNPEIQYVNLGSGFIGAVNERYGYQLEYFKKHIVAALGESSGKAYPPGEHYTLIAFGKDKFFVSDGITGQFVDASGTRLPDTPELSGFQSYDRVGPLLRASAILYDYERLAYYTPEGDLVWAKATALPTLELGDGITAAASEPIVNRFTSYSPITIAIEGNPQAEAAINTLTAQLPTIDVDFEESMMVDSTAFDIARRGDFLTVTINGYSYGIGAAHPNSFVDYRHYNLAENRWMQLADFIKDGEQGLLDISKLLLEKISSSEEAEAYWLEEGLKLRPDQAFTIDATGISIVFQQYEIGPYAMGMPTFSLSYEEIKPYLNLDSPAVAALWGKN